MSGDFSRDTSHAARLARYTRVLLQQGRPLLDADFNEQSAIHLELLRTFIADMVGSGWRPEKEKGTGGFNVEPVPPANPKNFKITKGHFYVGGILCDNPEDNCTYLEQPFLPHPDPFPSREKFVAYIECWERHLCAVQQPALREIALGGPDTAARAQIVWQVRVATADWVKEQTDQLNAALVERIKAVAADKNEQDALKEQQKKALPDSTKALLAEIKSPTADLRAKAQDWFDALAAAPPRLRAMAKRDASDNEACSISPDSIYRGRENQLYRVEIHQGGTLAGNVKPTFKWSRENGSVLFAVQSGKSEKSIVVAGLDGEVVTLTIPLETLGHDRRTGLCVGDWVEVTSEAFELDALAPPLGQLKQIDRTRRSVVVQVVKLTGSTFDFADFGACTLLRRWDQTEHLEANGTVAVAEATVTNAWMPLECGVQIQFQPGGVYRTGDYWLIPARVASGDVLWPQGDDGQGISGPTFVAPDGITRHRAAIHGS